jgi:tRNA-dihydrouridine synthase
MIGRGCLGNPWIFQQANNFVETGKLLPGPTAREKLTVILKHFEEKIKISGARKAVFEMRKHFAWYVKGLPGSAKFKVNLFQLTGVEDIKNMLSDYFLQIEKV